MIFSYQNHKFLFSLSAIIAMLAVTGCSNRQAAQAPPPVTVKALQVIQQDTPITYEYVGQVIAKKEVQIRAKISGNIMEKMVNGGDTVTQGQPLFLIDRRQYEAALLESQGQLAQSEAALNNSHLDTVRYQQLANQQAIANQVLDTALSAERQNAALVNVNRARVQRAEADLQDTLITAPFSGRLDTNDLSIGSFVQAGQTTLTTLSTLNPVFIQFSLSENEYLQFTHLGRGNSPTTWGKNLQLILSDGTPYPLTGQVEEVDRGMTQDTATLTLKAAFANPDGLLMPGMFARVVAPGEIRQGALLVPQRAVQQLLGKAMVTLVGEENKAEVRPVKLGPRVGNLWVIDEGLLPTDSVVVEGFDKAPSGTTLAVEMMNPEELQNIMKN